MKSSNPQVMVQAYRLLVETMVAEGMNYPLHLGVTEAGDGEDGRIKSAVGIGLYWKMVWAIPCAYPSPKNPKPKRRWLLRWWNGMLEERKSERRKAER